jgi:hypothetical protein
MEVITVESWEDFQSCTDELDGWAFRGQTHADWPLVSSLTRRLQAFCPDEDQWPQREERAVRIFRRKAHNYLSDREVVTDTLRCLALMQHHGAPTRLLDFTKSPFVASFFALERAMQDACVFALNTRALWSATPGFDASLTRDKIDPRVGRNFERYFAPNVHPVLWFGEPAEMDRRLVAQAGLFVVPGRLDLTLDEVLSHYGAPAALLKKIVLPKGLRERAMHALYRMNITYATVFPDLDGLAASMGYELEVMWGTSP